MVLARGTAFAVAALLACVFEVTRALPLSLGWHLLLFLEGCSTGAGLAAMAAAASAHPLPWGVWELAGFRCNPFAVTMLTLCGSGLSMLLIAASDAPTPPMPLGTFMSMMLRVPRRILAHHIIPLAILRMGGWSISAMMGLGTAIVIGSRATAEGLLPWGILATLRRQARRRGESPYSAMRTWLTDLMWGAALAAVVNALAITTGSVLVASALLFPSACTGLWRGTLLTFAASSVRLRRYWRALLVSCALAASLIFPLFASLVAIASGCSDDGSSAPAAAGDLASWCPHLSFARGVAGALGIAKLPHAAAMASGRQLLPVPGICPMGP